MVTWPTSFPMPQSSFEIDAEVGAVTSRLDSGRRRKYSRFTRVFRTFAMSWWLDDEQYRIFQGFYEVILNNGSDWFYMPMAIGGGIQTLRVRFVDDSYKGAYQEVMHWVVNVKVETEDQNSSSDEWLSGPDLPEGAVTAPVGTFYCLTEAAEGEPNFYKKESGSGNTGWVSQ